MKSHGPLSKQELQILFKGMLLSKDKRNKFIDLQVFLEEICKIPKRLPQGVNSEFLEKLVDLAGDFMSEETYKSFKERSEELKKEFPYGVSKHHNMYHSRTFVFDVVNRYEQNLKIPKNELELRIPKFIDEYREMIDNSQRNYFNEATDHISDGNSLSYTGFTVN